MTKAEAAGIIEGVRRSLEENPGQFHVHVTVTGASFVGGAGGPGGIIQATGGAAGSTTTGFIASAVSGDVQIQQAQQAVDQRISEICTSLKKIVAELRKSQPDKGLIAQAYQHLRDKWAIPLVTAVVSSVIDSAD